MRGGLAKCAYCMGNLTTFYAGTYKNRRGYRCITAANGFNRCEGVTIEMSVLDDEVWDFVAQIIRDPTEVDRLIEQWKIEDAAADRREYLTGEIGKIKKKQATLRDRLEEDLDDEDLADVKRRLREHKAKREGYEAELATETDLHEEWKQMQANIAEFLRECAEMREKLDDPSFTPSYSFKRKACVFFGIRAIVWKADHRPRIDMGIFPPSIVSTSISVWRKRWAMARLSEW